MARSVDPLTTALPKLISRMSLNELSQEATDFRPSSPEMIDGCREDERWLADFARQIVELSYAFSDLQSELLAELHLGESSLNGFLADLDGLTKAVAAEASYTRSRGAARRNAATRHHANYIKHHR